MKKIIDFLDKHWKIIAIVVYVLLIIFCILTIYYGFPDGFSFEKVDEPSLVCGFMLAVFWYCVHKIIDTIFYKHKSDKE